MSRIMSQALLLGLMAAMAGLLALFWGNPSREMALSLGAIGLILLSLGLEHRAKAVATRVPLPELAGDVGSFVLVFGLLDGVLKGVLPFLILAVLPDGHVLAWPLWVQVVITTLWIELAAWVSVARTILNLHETITRN